MNKANLILLGIIISILIAKLYLMMATKDNLGLPIELQLINISVLVSIAISLALMHKRSKISKAVIVLMVLLGCIELLWKYIINYNNLAYSFINIVGYFLFGCLLWYMADGKQINIKNLP